jgi:hypothetical protein
MPKVISVFDDHDSARRAVDHLVQAGFHRGDVHIARGGEADLFSSSTAPMQWPVPQHEHHEGQGVLSSIGHAMASVFGMDTPDAETQEFLEAVRRGHSVVVVEWADEAQSLRARQIMRELGALDVRERSRQWHALWSGDRSVAAPPRDYEDPASQRAERGRAERALAADQGDSERTWGLEGPAAGARERPDDTR